MLLQPKESFKLKNSSIEKKRIIIDLLYSKDALQFLMNFAATKRLPLFIPWKEEEIPRTTCTRWRETTRFDWLYPTIAPIGFTRVTATETADKAGLLRGEEEQIPRVWIRANDWQRFRSAGHGVPRDAASWVGRRKIYPHTATRTPVHVRHRQPDVSPAQLRLLHPPFVSKQLDAHYGKNHPSRGSFREDDDGESAAQGLWQRGEGDGYYHVDEYLRDLCFSLD